MKFSKIFLTSCLFLLSFPWAQSKPNIIVIMADDLGYGDISAFGSDTLHSPSILTPNIDALMSGGLRFNDFHSNGPVCTPTRAALLTGRYQQRADLETVLYVNERTLGMDVNEILISQIMKQAGYVTGIMGKWHLGIEPQFMPYNRGFDEHYGFTSGNIDYISHVDGAAYFDWYHNLDTLHEEGYTTDLITNHSLDFIEANKDKPFFLYVAQEAPHFPYQGRNDTAIRIPGNKNYGVQRADKNVAYKEMIEIMDEGIGKIVDKVRQVGIENNTFIFFFSDNGPTGPGSAGPLRSNKSNLFEGGHRVPAVAYWPGKIAAGGVTDETVITMDVFPTLANLAGMNLSGLDGVDLSALLFQGINLSARSLFWRYNLNANEKAAVRKGDWKLNIVNGDTTLFNLTDDLGEQNNLFSTRPAILTELANEFAAWEQDILQNKPITVTPVEKNGPYSVPIDFKIKNQLLIISELQDIAFKLQLIDLTGKEVLHRSINEFGAVDLSHLNSGIYILKIKVSDQTVLKKISFVWQ